MIKSKLIQTVAALFLIGAIGLLSGNTRASEARMASLMDNPMVLDLMDVVYYPGMLSVYGDTAFLTVFPAAPDGNVGVLAGADRVFGAWVHRESKWHDLDDTDAVFGNSFNLPPVYDLFDLYFGMRNGFGLRLTLSAGLDTLDTQTEGNSSLYSDGQSVFAVDLMPGYSIDRSRYHGDFGVGVTLNHFKVAVGGEEAYTTGWIPSFLLKHRSVFGPREDFLAWALDLTLTRRSYTAKALGDNSADGWFSRWVTSLVLGPRFKLPDNFTIWSGLKLEFEHLTGEIDGDKQERLMGIGAPGLVLSGELLLFELLTIRAGVDYDIYWYIESVPDPADDNEIGAKYRTMGQQFGWSSGLGLTLGAFQLDGTIRQQLYFNGPQLLGGNDPGFLGMISATYMW
jgi:hypothetical protein